jgi:uncharacterized protein
LALWKKIPADTQYILEVAALTHDIGIRMGEKKYGVGMVTGKVQEQEGPAVAKDMLEKLGCDPTGHRKSMLPYWSSSYF